MGQKPPREPIRPAPPPPPPRKDGAAVGGLMSKSEICALFDVPEDLVEAVDGEIAAMHAIWEANERFGRELARNWMQSFLKQWRAIVLPDGERHVIPINDDVVHDESRFCACKPRLVTEEGKPDVWAHHPIDGRSNLERKSN